MVLWVVTCNPQVDFEGTVVGYSLFQSLETSSNKTQSYKTSFGVIAPFCGVIHINFLGTNLSVEINAKSVFILSNKNSYVGSKNVLVLITPTQQF
jgi:hypothetical protein